eukprot:SAG31_NODE_30624_length_378_cov_1.100358_1_plen_70_part_00
MSPFGIAMLFDGAELSWLVAPRSLIVEHAKVEPAGPGAPPAKPGRRGGAAPGTVRTPDGASQLLPVNPN